MGDQGFAHKSTCFCLACAESKTTYFEVHAETRSGYNGAISGSWWEHKASEYATRLLESPVFLRSWIVAKEVA